MQTNQPAILLGAINSTYQHCSIGIRYLYANLGSLKTNCQLQEWTIKENSLTIAEDILKQKPKIFGLGVYIWNVDLALEVCSALKRLDPNLIVVLGGPEVSHEVDHSPFLKVSDYIIQGEADHAFQRLCQDLLATQPDLPRTSGTATVIGSVIPDIKSIQLPYREFSNEDIKNRIIYVEASRGCPYKCEYCLSSLDKSVRSFDLDVFLLEIDQLIARGARTFKFVDRTFNLSPTTSTRILQYFLDQIERAPQGEEFFLHFELVPDRLPIEIRELIAKFPAGSLQFEIGIQTLNPEVAKNVSRKNDLSKVEENFKYLNDFTQVHTHADLIVGLPGETLQSFGEGFDRLASWGPHEIQVGILKRLKGTPIIRHQSQFKMVYSEHSPFQVLQTSTLTFSELQLMNRFSKFWDLVFNNGEFPHFCQKMKASSTSLFGSFMKLVEFLSQRHPRAHSISLINLAESLYEFLLASEVSETEAFEIIRKDFCEGQKKRDLPPFLKTQLKPINQISKINENIHSRKNQRQVNHLVVPSGSV